MVKVSVIIPARNESARIAQAILRARIAGADQVIVCDGESTDATVGIAKTMPCELVFSPPGRGKQQNQAAFAADGDCLLFLHADTWLPEGGIKQIRSALARRSVMGGCFSQRIEASGWSYRLLERGNAARVRLWQLPYGDQGLFFRRDVFERLGGFPDVPFMEDVLMMRQFRQIARPILLPGPLAVDPRRWQQTGIVRQTMRNWALLAAEKIGVSPQRLAAYYRYS